MYDETSVQQSVQKLKCLDVTDIQRDDVLLADLQSLSVYIQSLIQAASSAKGTTSSAKKSTLPAKKTTLPAKKKSTSLAKKSTSLAKKSTSLAKKSTSLAKKSTSLAKKSTSLAKKTILPAKKTTLTVKNDRRRDRWEKIFEHCVQNARRYKEIDSSKLNGHRLLESELFNRLRSFRKDSAIPTETLDVQENLLASRTQLLEYCGLTLLIEKKIMDNECLKTLACQEISELLHIRSSSLMNYCLVRDYLEDGRHQLGDQYGYIDLFVGCWSQFARLRKSSRSKLFKRCQEEPIILEVSRMLSDSHIDRVCAYEGFIQSHITMIQSPLRDDSQHARVSTYDHFETSEREVVGHVDDRPQQMVDIGFSQWDDSLGERCEDMVDVGFSQWDDSLGEWYEDMVDVGFSQWDDSLGEWYEDMVDVGFSQWDDSLGEWCEDMVDIGFSQLADDPRDSAEVEQSNQVIGTIGIEDPFDWQKNVQFDDDYQLQQMVDANLFEWRDRSYQQSFDTSLPHWHDGHSQQTFQTFQTQIFPMVSYIERTSVV